MYPRLLSLLRGRAFAWGFYDKVVLQGNPGYEKNFVELNGYQWNLSQLLAHEMVHCLQFEKYGFWKSNPVAGIPEWKWEGYPEFIARASTGNILPQSISRLVEAEKHSNNGWISFPDGTGTVINYYKSWLLVWYCMDIKGMSYIRLLRDNTSGEAISDEMMTWYKSRLKDSIPGSKGYLFTAP
jgi:hypothetical protein